MPASSRSSSELVAAPTPPDSSAGTNLYLTFVLDGEAYATGILSIKEIIEYGGVTAVPLMPPTVRGVINLRGAVVPVLDLSLRFGRTATSIGRRSCVVIIETGPLDARIVIGVIVDAVMAVQEIAPEDIGPTPSFGMKIATQFIRGIGKAGGRFVILLDMEQVLSIDELAALGAAQVASAPLETQR
ncbi:chemotaxis protein CheW [Burkholderiaceae bacterium UC74_6]